MKNAASTASTGSAITLAEASRRFERWRRSKHRGRCIPAELWSAAVELAREHGVSKTATALRLEYYALKRRLEARDGEAEERRPTFVEVALPAVSSTPCIMEIADERGVKLRVELPARAAGEVGAVARTLWEAAR